jgi:hypothetical protein
VSALGNGDPDFVGPPGVEIVGIGGGGVEEPPLQASSSTIKSSGADRRSCIGVRPRTSGRAAASSG